MKGSAKESPTMEILGDVATTFERALDLRMEKQRIIASNLANINTPGYKALKMDFEASLTNALNGVENPVVVQASTDPAHSLDGNNVDMETELSDMSRNKLMYQVTTQILAAKLRQTTNVLDQEP
jgi:flagellar basal-body rod protein FlgB